MRPSADAGAAAAYNDTGADFVRQNRLAEAEQSFRRAIEASPAYDLAWHNLGWVLLAVERLDDAEAALRTAVGLRDTSPEAHNMLGCVFERKGELAAADREFARALELRPDFAQALYNKGTVAWRLGRLREAEAIYRRTLALEPQNMRARWNLGAVLLTRGAYKEGWSLYESRPEVAGENRYPMPVWRGESLQGKAILILREQGLGDMIQFARYARLLKSAGATRVGIVCEDSLRRIISTIDGIDQCEETEVPASKYDFWISLMSLPSRFGTTLETIPNRLPYVAAPRDGPRLPGSAGAGRRVGLVWAGNPRFEQQGRDEIPRERSLPLEHMLSLLDVPGVTFYSLQKDTPARRQLAEIPAPLRPIDVMDDVRDFADTAALIDQLDLVISVDTSVVHLAGALDKPVWLVNRFDTCWRWLDDRSDSPWYPGVLRIFRQPQPGDWASAIAATRTALVDFSQGA